MFTAEHQEGWKKVTATVHAKKGLMYCQREYS